MNKSVLNLMMITFTWPLLLTACGGDTETSADGSDTTTTVEVPAGPTFEEVCTSETAINLTVKEYHFGGQGDVFNFAPTEFTVKNSTWSMTNDSTGTMSLFNYTDDEVAAGKTDDQAEVRVDFKTRNGNKLSPGSYVGSQFADLEADVSIVFNKGEAHFNWVDGMPEVGSVTINFVDATNICGEFNLVSDDPTLIYIGTVKLNGTFKI